MTKALRLVGLVEMTNRDGRVVGNFDVSREDASGAVHLRITRKDINLLSIMSRETAMELATLLAGAVT